MGGTSTDVCLIRGGAAERSPQRSVDGLPVRLPQLDIHTVGAGGGSIAWIDDGGALRVGPALRRGQPRPRLLRPRRRATDRHRRQPGARPARPLACRSRAGSCSTARQLARAVATVAGGFAASGRPPRGIVAVANQEMVARHPGGHRRARPRPARPRAGRLRRRRPAARLRGRRRAGHPPGDGARRGRGVLGAGDRGGRPSSRCGRAASSRRSGSLGARELRAARTRAAPRARRRHGGVVRPALPRPGVRADGAARARRGARGAIPRGAPRAVRLRRRGGRDRADRDP